MEQIEIKLETSVAVALAVSKGWSPTIDDTTQPMLEDNYPQIANPVSYQDYIAAIAPQFITDVVLRAGQQAVIADFNSTFERIVDVVKAGNFDSLILAGNIQAIKDAVKNSL